MLGFRSELEVLSVVQNISDVCQVGCRRFYGKRCESQGGGLNALPLIAWSLGRGRDAEAGGEEGGAGEQIASWRGKPSIASTNSLAQGILHTCLYKAACNCNVWSITAL